MRHYSACILSALRVGHADHVAVGDGGGACGDDIVAVAEVSRDGGIRIVRGEDLYRNALCNIPVAQRGAFRHDGEDEAAVGVGTDGAVGNDEIIARALLPDGHGYLRAGGDVAVKVEGEKLIRQGVLFIRLNSAERGDDLIAPIVIAYRGRVADVQTLGLIVRDGEADGIAHIGHLYGAEDIVLQDGVARCAVDLGHCSGDIGGHGILVALAGELLYLLLLALYLI